MKTLKSLREELRAFNMDTDEELDLDSLADISIEDLLGDDLGDTDTTSPQSFEFDDLENISLDDYQGDIDGGNDSTLDNLSLDGDGDQDTGVDDGMAPDDFDLDNYDPSADAGDGDDLDQNTDPTNMDDSDATPDESSKDFQGEIRTVRGANLVFKRKMDDGNFEELWIYNVGNDIKRETQVRRAILAGTDVDPGSQESKDGSQHADTTTAGNVQFLHIVGLPQ